MAQISEAATILVYSFGELFNQAKLDEQRWEEYLVSVNQRIVDDVPCSARHQFLPHRPVLLCVTLSSVPTITHAQKAWVLGEAGLLTQHKIHHLQVNTNQSC